MTTNTQLITVDPDNRFEVRQQDKPAPFIPAGFQSVIRFSELVANSGMAPKGLESPDKCAVAIFHGMEVGMTPLAALQSIAVINGRPSVWGDGALAMVRASGLLDDIEEFYEGGNLWLEPPEFNEFGKQEKPGKPNPEFTAVCVTTRKGAKRPVRYEFSVMDAMVAGLWNKEGPWRTNPKRMLKFRARGFNLRDEFTDVMRGLVLAEEAQDYEDLRDVTPPKDEAPPETPKDEDPPAAGGDAPAKRRGRPRKDAVEPNKYQDGKGDVVEAEVIETKPAADKAEPEKPAETTAKPAEAKKEPDPKPEKKADPEPAGDDGQAFLDGLLAEVGPNRELKDYLKKLHPVLLKATSDAALREAWANREKYAAAGVERDHIVALRTWHKERVDRLDKAAAGAAGDEDPPADDNGGATFDYAGFLHDLDVKLGAEKTPDAVNTLFAQCTEEPLKLGLITAAQKDADLDPLLATHLERVDY